MAEKGSEREHAQTVLAGIDGARAEFRAFLRSISADRLVQRPQSGEWSPIENLRHLVFAEELHTRRFMGERPWSGVGLAPHFLASEEGFADVGSAPSDDLETVLTAWDEVHARTRVFVAEASPEVLAGNVGGVDGKPLGEVLEGTASHDLYHFRIIKALLGIASA